MSINIRKRTIKPEFPRSETVGKLSRDARLLFILLWTACDDEGRTRAASRMLASILYPYDTDAPGLIDGWLEELERVGAIVRYEVDGTTYLEVCKWKLHQRIDRPTQSLIPSFANIRESSCKEKEKEKDKDKKTRKPLNSPLFDSTPIGKPSDSTKPPEANGTGPNSNAGAKGRVSGHSDKPDANGEGIEPKPAKAKKTKSPPMPKPAVLAMPWPDPKSKLAAEQWWDYKTERREYLTEQGWRLNLQRAIENPSGFVVAVTEAIGNGSQGFYIKGASTNGSKQQAREQSAKTYRASSESSDSTLPFNADE